MKILILISTWFTGLVQLLEHINETGFAYNRMAADRFGRITNKLSVS